MYGITWATSEHTHAVSEYGIEHLDHAYNMAFIGPNWARGNGYRVDFLCEHIHLRPTELYARIETGGGHVVDEIAPGEIPEVCR